MRTRAFSWATHSTKDTGRRKQRGQSLLEFALVAPIFFLLLCGIFDFGHLFFVQMTLQDAIRQAGRFAVTGRQLKDPNDASKYLSRIDSIILTAQNSAVGANITDVKVSSLLGGAGSAGGPNDIVTVSVTNDMQLITPLIAQFFGSKGIYTFTVSASFRNEPFIPPSAP